MAWYARLTWTEGNPAKQGTGFKIYRSVNGGAYSLLGAVSINTLQYDAAVTPGNTYAFRITEYKTLWRQGGTYDIESPAAQIAEFGVPLSPAEVWGEAIGAGSLAIRWTPRAFTRAVSAQYKDGEVWTNLSLRNNLIHTQGAAINDWSVWTHYGNTSFWETCTQFYVTDFGRVFRGIPKPGLTSTYLYHQYPYSVVEGVVYTFGIGIRTDRREFLTLRAYIRQAAGQLATQTKYLVTDSTWRYVWFDLTPNATSNAAGIGIEIGGERLHGTPIECVAPFFGEAVRQSGLGDGTTEYRVRTEALADYVSDYVQGTGYVHQKVRVSWTKSGPRPGDGFLIERKVGNNGAWAYCGATPIGTTTFDDAALVEAQTHHYRVYEIKGRWTSGSAEGSVYVPVPWFPASNRPQNLRLTVLAVPTAVLLEWVEGAPSQVGTGFRIYRSVNGGAYQLVGTVGLSTPEWQDGSCTHNNFYTYRVVEYTGTAESDPAFASLGLPLSEEVLDLADYRQRTASFFREADEGAPWTDLYRRRVARDTVKSFLLAASAWRGIGRHSQLELWLDKESRAGLSRIVGEVLGLLTAQRSDFSRAIEEALQLVPEGAKGADKVGSESIGFLPALGRAIGRLTPQSLEWLEIAPRDCIRGIRETLGLSALACKGPIKTGIARVDWLAVLGRTASRALIGMLWLDATAERNLRLIPTIAVLGLEELGRRLIERNLIEAVRLGALSLRGAEKDSAEALGLVEAIARVLECGKAEALDLLDGDTRHASRVFLEAIPLAWGVYRNLNRATSDELELGLWYRRERYVPRLTVELVSLLDGDLWALSRSLAAGLPFTTRQTRDTSRKQLQVFALTDEFRRMWALSRLTGASLAITAHTRRYPRKLTEEELALLAAFDRLLSSVRLRQEVLRLIGTAKLPPGRSGYLFDREPYDAKQIPVVVGRRMRAEDI